MENVPGAASFPEILTAFGEPMMARAHHLGSAARRDTLIWTNIRGVEFLRQHYASHVRPPVTVGELLAKHGFAPQWSAPPRLRHSVLPKLLSRRGSNAYRMHGNQPGRGMLLRNGTWTEPDPDIRACGTGFDVDTAALPGIDVKLRHEIFGACLDANIGRCLVAAILCNQSESALPSVYSPMAHCLIFDTGATRHMNSLRSEFKTYRDEHMWIKGLCAYAVGSGDVEHVFELTNNGASFTRAITLRNVLHVPDLQLKSNGHIQRLFSWAAAQETRRDIRLHMDSHQNSIVFPDGSRLNLQRQGRLFSLPIHPPSVSYSTCALLSADDRQSRSLWHLRLGHLHDRGMNRLLSNRVPGVTFSAKGALPFCTSCAAVKSSVAARPRHCHPRPGYPVLCAWHGLLGTSYPVTPGQHLCSGSHLLRHLPHTPLFYHHPFLSHSMPGIPGCPCRVSQLLPAPPAPGQ